MATSVNTEAKRISRREFLTYLWGASAALLAAEAGGAAIWYALPHFRSGLPDGVFHIDPAKLPVANSDPIAFPVGKFWFSVTDRGLLALSMFCTYPADRSNFFKWVSTNHRFECPRCGSKYSLDGHHLHVDYSGPAQRNLDRFVIHVETPKGTFTTPADGSPVSIDGATSIMVNTNRMILGQQNR